MYTVLVVDDDPTWGHEATRRLEEAGMVATFHRGPFGTLCAVRVTQCDIVLLDMNMPKLDGAMLSRMIRDAFGVGRVRVLLCTKAEPGTLKLITKLTGLPAVSKAVPAEEFVHHVTTVVEGTSSPGHEPPIPPPDRMAAFFATIDANSLHALGGKIEATICWKSGCSSSTRVSSSKGMASSGDVPGRTSVTTSMADTSSSSENAAGTSAGSIEATGTTGATGTAAGGSSGGSDGIWAVGGASG